MSISPSSPVARLSKVVKRYTGRLALNDVDLALEPGAVTALLGPNGAGKSTLVGILTGRLEPSSGAVALFNRHPRDPEARARMGVMLQSAGLPEGLTVSETISLQAGYFKRRLKTKDILAQAGLSALAKRRCDKLSGGEQRRVQFACAIAGAPDFLVLDEPTTGFDAEARHALWGGVRAKAAEGAAVLLATHYLEEAEALADRIIVIVDGRIVADGPPTSIKAKVAGSTVRLRTTQPAAHLATLPAVAKVNHQGADTMLLTTDARATVTALFQLDPTLTHFEVSAASLEDALAAIIANAKTENA